MDKGKGAARARIGSLGQPWTDGSLQLVARRVPRGEKTCDCRKQDRQALDTQVASRGLGQVAGRDTAQPVGEEGCSEVGEEDVIRRMEHVGQQGGGGTSHEVHGEQGMPALAEQNHRGGLESMRHAYSIWQW